MPRADELLKLAEEMQTLSAYNVLEQGRLIRVLRDAVLELIRARSTGGDGDE